MAYGHGWVGFDLDGTLAEYHGWGDGSVGEPVPAMAAILKGFLEAGVECRIVTARVGPQRDARERAKQHDRIYDWCVKHFGRALYTTNEKDFNMVLLFDDRVVTVEPNTGVLLAPRPGHCDGIFQVFDPWKALEEV